MKNDNNNDNKIRKKRVSSSNSQSKSTVRKSSYTRSSGSSSSSKSSRGSSTVKTSNVKRKRRVPSRRKKRKFSKTKIAFSVFFAGIIISFSIILAVIFSSLRDVKPVTLADLNKRTYVTTTLLYSNGEKMSTAPSIGKKTPVPLSKMSPYLKKAIVSIEDERFYEHHGFDFKGLVRSGVMTLLGKRQGGSTITMQVSKMLLTSTEQTIDRKIRDLYYSTELEKKLTKEQILELYLNNFFVGKGLSGAEAGARGYFDKSAKDLTLAESALLAGSTKNPAAYSAYKSDKLDGTESKEDLDHRILTFVNTKDDSFDDPSETELKMIDKLYNWGLINEGVYKQAKSGAIVIRKAVNNPKAKERQETVLGKMKELGYITQKEYTEALSEKIVIKLPEESKKVSNSVEDLVESEVISSLMEQGNTREESENMYYNGGLIINTTIDPKIQEAIESEYNNSSNFPGNILGPDGVYQPQSATVIIDYKTGQIKGLVGGRNISGRKTLNRATTPRQPGSTIKPLAIYTPAIDTLSITQATAFSDARGGYRFEENRKWNPKTTTNGSGSMSLRLGLAKSSNTVAVKVAELLGNSYDESVDIMIDYLKNFGITSLADNKATSDSNNTDRRFPALTLGGLTYGISPLQLTTAYGALANGGQYIEPTIFTSIKSFDDQSIVQSNPEKKRVVDPQVAYVMTDMLKAVITEGTAGKAALPNKMPTAGKTGTTNSSKEAWFVGYTPYYVAATYIADDAGVRTPDGKIVKTRNIGGGSSSSAILWQKIMSKIHKNLKVKDFEKPDKIYFTKINLRDGGASSYGVNAAFIDGTSTDRVSTAPIESKKEYNHESENKPSGNNDGNSGDGNNSNNDNKPAQPDNNNKPAQPDNNNNQNNAGNNKPTQPDNNNNQ
ncbi:transglycosylase domain-containing protein [Peptacetobacter sp.]|uniref:transglycosylase domain-containing protein n=1 Tax=Peptacetobacter sp. TaxID=2991975 RepID=UPI00261F5E6E|nr:transglycosylase domain-containing protein [Peptacetobacter sp.]